MGGLGNQLFQMAFAIAYCEKYGHTLHAPESVLEKVFQLSFPRPTRELPSRNEDTANGEGDIQLYGYFQNQKSIDLYTRTKAKEWLKFRPEIYEKLSTINKHEFVAHRRLCDYRNLGYPIPSAASYSHAIMKCFKGDAGKLVWLISDEQPSVAGLFPKDIDLIGDFYQMMCAKVLFRANSTFSYWAWVLADENQRVFSPIIDGLGGGEVECAFTEASWPRFVCLDFVTDLFLKPCRKSRGR